MHHGSPQKPFSGPRPQASGAIPEIIYIWSLHVQVLRTLDVDVDAIDKIVSRY